MVSKKINTNKKVHSDKAKEDALLDETMKLIAGYEEGLSARDFKSMSDCNCQSHDKPKMVVNDTKHVSKKK